MHKGVFIINLSFGGRGRLNHRGRGQKTLKCFLGGGHLSFKIASGGGGGIMKVFSCHVDPKNGMQPQVKCKPSFSQGRYSSPCPGKKIRDFSAQYVVSRERVERTEPWLVKVHQSQGKTRKSKSKEAEICGRLWLGFSVRTRKARDTHNAWSR